MVWGFVGKVLNYLGFNNTRTPSITIDPVVLADQTATLNEYLNVIIQNSEALYNVVVLLVEQHKTTPFNTDSQRFVSILATTRSDDGLSPIHHYASRGNIDSIKILISMGANIETETDIGRSSLHFAAIGNHLELAKVLIKEFSVEKNLLDEDGDTPLHLAVSNNHGEMVKLLVELGANLEEGDWTPLLCAASEGRLEMVKLLLELGASANTCSEDGSTPLLGACSFVAVQDNSTVEILRLLLDYGADVNSSDHDGHTALSLSASNNHKPSIKLLLSKGAKVIQPRHGDKSALESCALKSDLEMVSLLLDSGADINARAPDSGDTVLHLLCRDTGIEPQEMIKKLVSRGANINQQSKCGCTPLHEAVKTNNHLVATLLVELGASVTSTSVFGNTPLHMAAKGGHFDTVELLVKSGAKVNALNIKECTALAKAASCGYLAIVKFLLQNGAAVNEPDTKGRTALHKAVMNGETQLVRELLRFGADVNSKDGEGATPLILAAHKDYLALVQCIVEGGARLNEVNSSGDTALLIATMTGNLITTSYLLSKGAAITQNYARKTPLHNAVLYCPSTEVIKELLKYGADLKATDNFKETALHMAAYSAPAPCLRVLLEANGKDIINEVNYKQLTALHYASERNEVETVELLLEYGAAIEVEDKDNRTPLHIATLSERPDTVEKLLAKGANIEARDRKQATPLFLAAQYQAAEVVRLMLNSGKVDKRVAEMADYDHRTPLFVAAKKGNLEIVEMLHSRANASVSVRDKNGNSALAAAANSGHTEVVKFLVLAGAAGEISPTPSDIDCTVCLGKCVAPVQFGCGHSFCMHCVVALQANRVGKCPNCRKRFNRKTF